MHQGHEAEPVGMGGKHIGDGAADEPVDEHDRVGVDAPQVSAKQAAGEGVRDGPPARRRVLADRPAELGEAAAYAAVIDVPAAWALRVVDALREDDVDLGQRCRHRFALTVPSHRTPTRCATRGG